MSFTQQSDQLTASAAHIATELTRLLRESKRSQAEFARFCGVSRQAVSGWLNTGRIAKDKLGAAADFLGVDVRVLLPRGAETALAFPDRSIPAQQPPEAGGTVNIHILDTQPVTRMVAWEELHMHDQLPNVYRLTLRDDSLAPDLRQGDYVELQRDLAGSAATGDWVLVRTADGQHHLREFIALGAEGWVAAPVNKAGKYQAVTSQAGAVVVAVYIAGGVVGRKSRR